MLTRPTMQTTWPLALLLVATLAATVVAQQAQPKSPAPRTAQPTAKQPAAKSAPPAAATPAARQPVDKEDAAKKAEILNSTQWRRAMFELTEWLSAQQIYTPAQVTQLKADFNKQVAGMTSVELSFLLADLNEKFKLMDTKEAREARDWVGRYLSILADKKARAGAQGRAQRADDDRGAIGAGVSENRSPPRQAQRNQAAFDRTRQSAVENTLEQDRFERDTYVQNRSNFPTDANTYSPYRNAPARGIQDLRPAPQSTNFYVGAYGGFGMSISPSSW